MRDFVSGITAFVFLGGVVAAGAYALGLIGGNAGASAEVRFRTAKVERGEVVDGVQASGTVQPVVLVTVGTQVSGVISKILVDFNSKVKEGEVLALIDPRRLEAQVVQSRAAVTRARADADRVRALIVQAEKELARQRSLAERNLIGQAELEAAVANVESLSAQQGVAQAAITQAEAQLQGDETNLGYCTVLSPIDGIVVSRAVDVGQTVAASLSAPILFTIANDMTKVLVLATVPEADIGRIRAGQRVRFTVDAYPEQTFEGTVSQVRLAATTVQNVVTYTVIVDAANPRELLLPGMTANATFEVARSAPDALRVPATALRLKPPAELVLGGAAAQGGPRAATETAAAGGADGPRAASGTAGAEGGPGHGPGGSGRRRDGAGGAPGAGARSSLGVVYVPAEKGLLRPVRVRQGISDGAFTVVELRDPSALPEGAEVVTAVVRETEDAAVTNPFAPPRMPGGGRSAFGGGGAGAGMGGGRR